MTNATTTLGRHDIFLSYPSADRAQALAVDSTKNHTNVDFRVDL